MNDTIHLPDIQFNVSEHKVHQSVHTITDSEVILETVRSTIKKLSTERAFLPTNILFTFKTQFIPLKFMSHFILPNQFIGFISVVQHQANYLP